MGLRTDVVDQTVNGICKREGKYLTFTLAEDEELKQLEKISV